MAGEIVVSRDLIPQQIPQPEPETAPEADFDQFMRYFQGTTLPYGMMDIFTRASGSASSYAPVDDEEEEEEEATMSGYQPYLAYYNQGGGY